MAQSKNFLFSIIANFRNKASAGLNKLRKDILGVGKAAKTVGGGSMLGALAGGGPIAGFLMAGLTGVVSAARAVARLAVRAVTSVIRGAVGLIKAAVGMLVKAATAVVRLGVRTITGVIRAGLKAGLVGIAAAGALIGWTLVKGIGENLDLDDVRARLKLLIGDAARDVEEFARTLSLRSKYTPMAMLNAAVAIEAVGASSKRYLKDLADWASGAGKPLEQLVELFQRAKTGQFGEAMEGARRALISIKDMQREGATFNAGNAFQGSPDQFLGYLLAAARRRFEGMGEAAARVGKGPISTLIGIIQDLRKALAGRWAKLFTAGLNDLNDSLLRLAESPHWQAIVKWSDKVADAVDKNIRGIIKWATTTEFSLDNIKKGFAELAPVLENMKTAMVAAFRWAAAEARLIFAHLWNDVFGDMVDNLRSKITPAIAAIRADIEANRLAMIERTKDMGPAARAGAKTGFEHGSIPAQMLAGTLGTVIKALGAVNEAADAVERRAAEIQAQADAAAQDFNAAGQALGANVAGAAQAAFPPKPVDPAAAGAAAEAAAVDARAAAFAEHPGLARIQRTIDEKQRVADHLARMGQGGKAAEVAAAAARMADAFEGLLDLAVEDNVVTIEEMKRIEKTMARLGSQQRLNILAIRRLSVGHAR